jgi:hypothetical protein
MDRTDGKSKNGDSRIKSPIPVPQISQYLFGLNEHELKVVHAILEKSHKTTWEQVAKKLGVSRRQLYTWRQSSRIQEPLRNISRELLISDLPDIYKALVKKAKSGDCVAMKLYFEIVERIDEKKQKAAEFGKGSDPLQEIIDLIHKNNPENIIETGGPKANNNGIRSDL